MDLRWDRKYDELYFVDFEMNRESTIISIAMKISSAEIPWMYPNKDFARFGWFLILCVKISSIICVTNKRVFSVLLKCENVFFTGQNI